MPPDRSSFTALNTSHQIPEWMGSFTLSAPPNTDLWRKPPAQNISTAPVLFTCLRQPFVAAEVTVSADWTLEWDQGGLVIFAGIPQGIHNPSTPATAPAPASPLSDPLPRPDRPPPYTPPSPNAPKWVKLSLEFSCGSPHASSVVATSDGADWCLSALPNCSRTELRLKMERIGYSLWLWYLDESMDSGAPLPPPPYAGNGTVGGVARHGLWRKLREVTWFFWGVEDKAVRVGVYACRPVGPEGPGGRGRRREGDSGDLVVDFEDLEIF